MRTWYKQAGPLGLGVLTVIVVALFLFADPIGFKSRTAGNIDLDELSLRGQRIYAVNCAQCHGNRLEGQPNWMTPYSNGRMPAPPHDEKGHTWHHADDELFEIVRIGMAAYIGGSYESDMPAFGRRLNDADIRAVLSFIKSNWPDEIKDRQIHISSQRR